MSSIKLNSEGIKRVEKAQAMKGYSQAKWAREAEIGESTLKRFVSGKSVRADTFKNLCETIGLADWYGLVAWDDTDSTKVESLTNDLNALVAPKHDAETSSLDVEESLSSIAIAGNFSERRKLKVMALVELLKEELSEVSYYIIKS